MKGFGKTTHPPVIGIPVATPLKNTRSILDSTSCYNLIISSVAAASLSWIPYEEDAEGNRIPTIIFKGQPTSFHAFVLFVMFGFAASFSALFSSNRPEMERVFRTCSVFFLCSAAAVLVYAALLLI